MPEHYDKWKCDMEKWIAVSTCAIDEYIQHADAQGITPLTGVLVDMTKIARKIQDQNNWAEFRTFCKIQFKHLCTRYNQINIDTLEETIKCIEGDTPIPQDLQDVIKQRVEFWRQTLLSAEEFNLERDIQIRLVQIHETGGYFLTVLPGRHIDGRSTPDLPRTKPNTY
ncbi:uncharacterized protein LOC127833338 [Dreissena polymorpha]|uniref:Uncharacterized protein n=1 Tax=Dreissena polymorpha TaxID=45954 RepID=A0A9D4JFK0_DREPO|nr:uncharacterized protein LOC127833338 [Dreissena polymorpha]XP_052214481.1 uncharacterized protein LOC127833338 [Dreissena polymorpha]KAH3810936.1 hypothetical protein DPMN_139335 [Dreissena polymorpha]